MSERRRGLARFFRETVSWLTLAGLMTTACKPQTVTATLAPQPSPSPDIVLRRQPVSTPELVPTSTLEQPSPTPLLDSETDSTLLFSVALCVDLNRDDRCGPEDFSLSNVSLTGDGNNVTNENGEVNMLFSVNEDGTLDPQLLVPGSFTINGNVVLLSGFSIDKEALDIDVLYLDEENNGSGVSG